LLIKVASIVGTKVQVYFIDNEELYGKKTIKKSHSKNGIHAEFFARGIIETVKKLRWSPDIIHCQGTITHLVPYLLKNLYNDEPTVCRAKVITTLFEKDSIKTAQAAIDNSDGIILASNHYNKNLVNYLAESKVKILKNAGEDYVKKYIEFYNKV
jgi:starch synthase